MYIKLASSRKQLQVARRVWPFAKDYYARVVRDLITREFGLPILEISGDLADFRGYNSQQARDLVDCFIEQLG